MERCPSCSQSRWVYPRAVAIAEFVEWLTGLSPYECLSCGWRGWRRKRSTSHPLANRVTRLQPMLASGARVLDQLAATGIRRLEALRRVRVPRIAKWLMPAFVVGIVLGGLLFPGEDSDGEPETLSAADLSNSIQPAGPTSVSDEVAVDPLHPSDGPGAGAARSPRVVPVSGATLANAPVTRRPPGPRAPVASRSTPKRASTALRPAAVKPPQYRGSLAVESDPAGAVVSIDGRVVGSTPIIVKDLPAGSCVVRVESSGYERWSAAARVVANQQSRVTATLRPASRP